MNRNIILLSLVSFLNDFSSEMILAVLPLFIVELGGGGISIGLIGGTREAIANLLKVFSGYMSDRLKRKKPFVFAGYLVSSVFKLLLGFSKTPVQILIAISLERIGKGIRTAPRDAIISLSGKSAGKSFGIHRAFDTLGAFLGSLLAIYLIKNFNLPYGNVILIAAILSVIALFPVLFVKEPEEGNSRKRTEKGKVQISRELKQFLIISALFSFSNLSYMFLIVKAQTISGSNITPLILYAVFNLVYALFSIPAGIASDKFGRETVLSLGYILFGVSLFIVIFSNSIPPLVIVFLLYGLSMAIVNGIQRAFVADLSEETFRGSAFGLFHVVTGFAILLGNVFAGFLWNLSTDITLLVYGIISLLSGLLLAFKSPFCVKTT
ncbi:MFS transporter [Desulfurobacterium crinifex]